MPERRADVVDLAAYRARRAEEARQRQDAVQMFPAVPIVWWPVWVYVPVVPVG